MALCEEKRELLRLLQLWVNMAKAMQGFYLCACMAIMSRRRRIRRENTSRVEHTPSYASSGSRKRKRNNIDSDDDFLLKGLDKIVHTLLEGFKEASEHLGMCIDRVEREKRMDSMRKSLYVDVMKVEGLSQQELLLAYGKMMSNENMMIGFYGVPQEVKADLIRQIIA